MIRRVEYIGQRRMLGHFGVAGHGHDLGDGKAVSLDEDVVETTLELGHVVRVGGTAARTDQVQGLVKLDSTAELFLAT